MNIGDNVTSLPDTPLTIQCPVSGVPPPKLTWTKDGKPLTTGEAFTVTKAGTLLVRGSMQGDSGLYTCTATNVAGNASVSSRVTIVGKF